MGRGQGQGSDSAHPLRRVRRGQGSTPAPDAREWTPAIVHVFGPNIAQREDRRGWTVIFRELTGEMFRDPILEVPISNEDHDSLGRRNDALNAMALAELLEERQAPVVDPGVYGLSPEEVEAKWEALVARWIPNGEPILMPGPRPRR